MNYVWELAPWLPYNIPAGNFNATYEIVNAFEVYETGAQIGERLGELFVEPILRISGKVFDIDVFTKDARVYVSETVRSIIDRSNSEVEFVKVSLHEKSLVPSRPYFLMNVISVVDSFPEEGTLEEKSRSGESQSRHGQDASTEDVFLCSSSPGYVYCSDRLAAELIRDGVVGFRFLDPRNCDPAGYMRVRTVRGVEREVGWDEKNAIERLEIVEALELAGLPS